MANSDTNNVSPPQKIPIHYFKKYLFIYLAVPGLSCGTQDLLVVAHGIFTCGMQTLSCSMWDLVP